MHFRHHNSVYFLLCYMCPAWLNSSLLISCWDSWCYDQFVILFYFRSAPGCERATWENVAGAPHCVCALLWSMECESVLRIRAQRGTCHMVVKVPELIKSQRLSSSFIFTTTVDFQVIVIWHWDWLFSPISTISLCTGFEIFQHVTVDISVSIYTPQEVKVGK